MTDLAALSAAHRARVHDLLGLDDAVVVATSPAAVVYCSGYRSMGLDTDPGQRMAVVFTRAGWILVGPAADRWAATEAGDGALRFWSYRTFHFADEDGVPGLAEHRPFAGFDEAVAAAVAALAPRGVLRVAAEGTAGLPHAAGVDPAVAETAFRRARAVKDGAEIGLLRAATAATEAALRRGLAEARAGITELDLAATIAAEMIRAGVRPGFVVVGSGPRGAFADAPASRRRLAAGDLVRFDVGGTLDGYWSDVAATAVVGAPSAEQRRVGAAVRAGQLAALAAVGPGARTDAIFDAAVAAVRAGGLPDFRRHHVGHGLGLEAHEWPTFGPAAPATLEPGMVVNVEPPYYRPGWGGLMVEATLLVTATGAEPLTTLAPELVILPA